MIIEIELGLLTKSSLLIAHTGEPILPSSSMSSSAKATLSPSLAKLAWAAPGTVPSDIPGFERFRSVGMRACPLPPRGESQTDHWLSPSVRPVE